MNFSCLTVQNEKKEKRIYVFFFKNIFKIHLFTTTIKKKWKKEPNLIKKQLMR